MVSNGTHQNHESTSPTKNSINNNNNVTSSSIIDSSPIQSSNNNLNNSNGLVESPDDYNKHFDSNLGNDIFSFN